MLIRIEKTNEVSVAAPFYTKLDEIHAFIHEKADWIKKKMAEVERDNDLLKKRNYEDGNEFLFLGKKFPLTIKKTNISKVRLTFDDFQWTATVPAGLKEQQQKSEVKQNMIKWYRTQAQEVIGGRVFFYARQMGVEPQKIAIRTQKRIWGSCDHRRKIIHLNWMLILSPLRVIDYVVVHELCHLKVNNHSKLFWDEVKKVLPDYKKEVAWLKANALDMVLP